MSKFILFTLLILFINFTLSKTHENTTENNFSGQFAALHIMLEQKFLAIDQKFLAIDQKFADVNQKFLGIDIKFSDMNQKIVNLDTKMTIELKDIDNKIEKLQGDFSTKIEKLQGDFNNISFWQTFIVSPIWLVLYSLITVFFGAIFKLKILKFILRNSVSKFIIDSTVESIKDLIAEEKKE
jgi:hypothetical protein